MQRIKAIMGYAIAVCMIIIVPATFVGMDSFGAVLVKAGQITISPLYSGGEVAKVIDHGEYRTEVHEAVFAGLFQPSQKGFVQVNWIKVQSLPDRLREDIDYDEDGVVDFSIECDIKEDRAAIIPINPKVLGLEDTYWLEDAFAVRVVLKNPDKG